MLQSKQHLTNLIRSRLKTRKNHKMRQKNKKLKIVSILNYNYYKKSCKIVKRSKYRFTKEVNPLNNQIRLIKRFLSLKISKLSILKTIKVEYFSTLSLLYLSFYSIYDKNQAFLRIITKAQAIHQFNPKVHCFLEMIMNYD